MEKYIYIVLATLVIITDFSLAYFTFKSKKESTRYFVTTLVLLGLMEFFYTMTFFVGNSYMGAKITMGTFFAIIPFMLFYLLLHIMYYTGVKFKKKQRTLINLALCFVVADFLIQITNPLTEWSISFGYDPNLIFPWVFQNHFLYSFHVYVLCYALIIIMVVYITRKIISTPPVYRRKYYTIIFGLVACIAFNFVCLFFQDLGLLDYSQFSYSLCAFIMYWDIFHNSQKGMLNAIRQVVLDEIGQAVILFGEENALASMNRLAKFLVPNWKQGEPYYLKEFLKTWKFSPELELSNEQTTFLWNYEIYTYRVDFRVILDDKNRTIGRLFVFTDTSLEYDLLTGFHTRNSFERYIRNNAHPFKNAAIAICDINRLAEINKTLGEEVGDQCIIHMVEQLKKYCSKDTYFVRLNDANLMAISPKHSAKQMHDCLEKVRQGCHEKELDNFRMDMQYAVSVTNTDTDIEKAVENARNSVRIQKLMDHTSAHSSLLDSLAQTLIESDEETEAHVARTRVMGEQLGRRLNFTDLQLSNLSLLCLLHDIGKIGIPIEILNKPERLDPYEWKIMKTHTEKGYRIARASEELSSIAECILYHHEAWDGSGYPYGLSKESIPVLSRIIAIVDAYDAMTHDRPYHKAISKEEACEELRRCAGKQFDPYITSQFLSMINEEETVSVIEQKVNEIQNSDAKKHHVHALSICELELDEELNIVSMNKEARNLTGFDEEYIQKYNPTILSLIPPKDIADFKEEIILQKEETIKSLEFRIQGRKGIVCSVIGTSRTLENGHEIIRFTDLDDTRLIQDIKEMEEEKRVRQIDRWGNVIRKDSLTGLYNHEAFVNNVEEQFLDPEKQVIFMIMDVDNFKGYNDTYGHMAGDSLLSFVAKILQQQVEKDGFAGRLGGDEFAAVIVCDKQNQNPCIQRRRIQMIYNTLISQIQTLPQSCTISMGAVKATQDMNSFKHVYQSADKALYQAKDRGRSQLVFYEDLQGENA
ncbi:MAG: diguanylate cyclase [Firmicutes bacterium]|nr:diguanylate cyclase [Bacillota bacterium]